MLHVVWNKAPLDEVVCSHEPICQILGQWLDSWWQLSWTITSTLRVITCDLTGDVMLSNIGTQCSFHGVRGGDVVTVANGKPCKS